MFTETFAELFAEQRSARISCYGRQAMVHGLGTVRLKRVTQSVIGVLLAATLCAIAGPVSATAQTAPGVQIYSLPNDIDVPGPAVTPLITADLMLQQGESRRVVAQVDALSHSTGNFSSIDYSVAIQCLDGGTGAQAGLLATAETSLVPGSAALLRPSLLFTAPHTGLYHCQLQGEVGSGSASTVMTLFQGLTYLVVSTGDEVGSFLWHNPDCDSPGTLPTCTYLGANEAKQSVYLFYDDGSPQYQWTAANNATSASLTANVELTTCGHTASCNGKRGDSDRSTVKSRLEAVQLFPGGGECNVTSSIERTDDIMIIPHHANIPYNLNVPILATCGSRNFKVRLHMTWVSGNTIKIDGYRPDIPNHLTDETETHAFIVTSSYAPGTTVVPPVIGLTQSAAQTTLAAAQLTVGVVSSVESARPAGTVVAQFASAGTVVPVNSSVNLYLSLGFMTFTGNGSASKPPQALSLARSRANSMATAAGFSLANCTETDESVEPNGRGYDASVTLSCSL